MKNKEKTYSVVKNIFKSGMFITLLLCGMQAGGMFVDYKHEFGQDKTWIEFITHKEKVTYNPLYELPPQGFIDRVQGVNTLTRLVWLGIFFFVMFEIFAYLQNKDEHWSTQARKWLDKKIDTSNIK